MQTLELQKRKKKSETFHGNLTFPHVTKIIVWFQGYYVRNFSDPFHQMQLWGEKNNLFNDLEVSSPMDLHGEKCAFIHTFENNHKMRILKK